MTAHADLSGVSASTHTRGRYEAAPWFNLPSCAACQSVASVGGEGMRAFRVYKVAPNGHIVQGEWLDAPSVAAAELAAAERCVNDVGTCEIWDGPRRMAQFACGARPAAGLHDGAGRG